jgi:hypothetical protein
MDDRDTIECLNLNTWFEIRGASWWSPQSRGIWWSSTLTRGTKGGPRVIPLRCTRPRYASSYHRYMPHFTTAPCSNAVFLVRCLLYLSCLFFEFFSAMEINQSGTGSFKTKMDESSLSLWQISINYVITRLALLWLHVLVHEKHIPFILYFFWAWDFIKFLLHIMTSPYML